MSEPAQVEQNHESRMIPWIDRLSKLPYWLLIAILLALFFVWNMLSQADYRVIFDATVKGLGTTLYVAFIAFVLATLLGLIIGLMRVSRKRCSGDLIVLRRNCPRHPDVGDSVLHCFRRSTGPGGRSQWLGRPLIERGS